MGRSLLAAVLALALAATAASQQRSPAFLTVVGPDGKPLPGAEVTCVFTPDAANPWPKDVVVATTGDRGRARCDLLLRRLYVAWAVGAADELGARLVSDPVPLLASGRVVELRAIDRRMPRTVRVRGQGAWRNVGAVGLRWFPDAREDAHRDLPWPATDDVELPASPFTVGVLGLIDAQGEMLVTTRVDVEADALPEFVPPMELLAEVTDGNDGPLAGASIGYERPQCALGWPLLRVGRTTSFTPRRVGATDGSGTLRFFAPVPVDQSSRGAANTPLLVTASKPGRALDTRRVTNAGSVPFTLVEQGKASIDLLGAANTRAEAGASAGARTTRLGAGGLGAIISGQGLLRVDGDAAPWTVHGACGDVLPRVQLCTATPGVVLHDWVGSRGQEFTFDLRNMRRIDVQTQDASGGPLACAVAVGRVGDAQPLQWCAALATDPAGRATLYVPACEWFVFATTTTANAMAIVPADGAASVVLRLESVPTMRVRVVDDRGVAIVGARVRAHAITYGGLKRDDLATQWQKVLAELLSCYLPLARSDADGFLHIPQFKERGLEAQVIVGDGSRRCPPFALGGDGNAVVTLQD